LKFQKQTSDHAIKAPLTLRPLVFSNNTTNGAANLVKVVHKQSCFPLWKTGNTHTLACQSITTMALNPITIIPPPIDYPNMLQIHQWNTLIISTVNAAKESANGEYL
jgi:hypothetical protein